MKTVRSANPSMPFASKDDQSLRVVEAIRRQDGSRGTLPGTSAHESEHARLTRILAELPAIEPSRGAFRRTIRRAELRRIVPLSDSTIYEMERNGDFPRRFHLTARCVVWDLQEVEAWVDMRRNESIARNDNAVHHPDVHQRRLRPVKKVRPA
jgi:prophage regulatory protein